MFERFFGKTRLGVTLARRAEIEGDLARATQLWIDAGEAHEAARVMMMRGDVELDSSKRLQHYVQAIALAPEGHVVRGLARKKRALLAIEIARSGTTSAASRRDLLEAARELEELGDASDAAAAYALAGDLEGQTRSLVQAGDVDTLEEVLDRDRDRARGERATRDSHTEVERLVAGGERREAVARARSSANEENERAILARRATAPRMTIELHGSRIALVLGDRVVVGRSDGAIVVPSHAISRAHLAVARTGDGITVRDLGSRNGTFLRGIRIGGPLTVPPEGIEVKLGGEVPCRVAWNSSPLGGVTIDVAGERYVAPLGTAPLGIGAWRIEVSADLWAELVTADAPPAYLGVTRLGARTALLAGDAIGEARRGAVVLRIVG